MLPASLLYFQQLGWHHWLLEYPCWSHLIPQFLIDLKECKMYKYSEKCTHVFFTISWEKVELVPISHSHKLMSSQPGTKDCPAEIGCVKMRWGFKYLPINYVVQDKFRQFLGVGYQFFQLLHWKVHESCVGGGKHSPRPSYKHKQDMFYNHHSQPLLLL